MNLFSKNSVNILATFLAATFTVTLTGCASSPNGTTDRTDRAERRTHPNALTLSIIGTNDIHGTLAPLNEYVGAQRIDVGGVALFTAHYKRLQDEWNDAVLWADAGDEFQGTIESNAFEGAPIVDWFNKTGLHAAAIGNHEFDFGPPGLASTANVNGSDPVGALKERLAQARFPYLSANLIERKTERLPNWPGLVSRALIERPTRTPSGSTGPRVRVGIIGLTTLETPQTTLADNIKELDFTPLKDALLRESRSLKNQGAHAIVLVAHVGLKCGFGRSVPGLRVRTIRTPQADCEPASEMVQLLKSVPTGTVHAVVSGHSHQIIHHWVAGVPVIQSGAQLRYFSAIHLRFDPSSKEPLSEDHEIEGPFPLCSHFFENQGDCNTVRPAPAQGRGALVKATFQGRPIEPDADVARDVAALREKTQSLSSRVITELKHAWPHARERESALGRLVADSFREAGRADIALTNPGGIRAPFRAGALTYEELFQALPFENEVVVLSLSGKDLKLLLRVAQAGSRGFFPVSGLKLRVLDLKVDAPSDDLNQDGKIEPWEIRRFLSTVGEIDDEKTYRVATNDFLVSGGDGWGWVMSQIAPKTIERTGVLCRDALENYLKTGGEAKTLRSGERLIFDTNKSSRKPRRSSKIRKR